MSESRYIRFEVVTPGEMWLVKNKRRGDILGSVEWYSRWRRFVFGPEFGPVLDAICLRDIAAFLDEQTAKRKQEHPA